MNPNKADSVTERRQNTHTFCLINVGDTRTEWAGKFLSSGETVFLAWYWVYHSQISFIRSVNHLTTCFIALNGYRISSEDTVIKSLNSPNKIWVAHSVLLGCTEWAVVSTEWDTRVINYQTLPNQHQKA